MWNVYCMNVTAVTATKNYTSQQHCLDVADIGKDPTGSLEVSLLLLNVNGVRLSSFLRPRPSLNISFVGV